MTRRWFSAFLLALLLTVPAAAQDLFTDVPADHWAYDAVKELSEKGYMDGYLDGTFKGRKIVSRYELALILARILHTMESIEQSGGVVPEVDEQLAGRLSEEFRGELESLGVRMDDVEQRVDEIEAKLDEKPKLKVFGFYQANQRFVEDSQSTYNDPRNYEDKHGSLIHPWDPNQDTMDDTDLPGFGPLYQNVFLKVLANPYDNVETYLELNTWVYGRYFDRKYYQEQTDEQNPTLFDLQSERGVQVQKAHFKLTNPTLNFRVFAGEKLTPLNNPTQLTTTKYWIFFPDFGMELNGSFGPISYFGGLYTEEKGDATENASGSGYTNKNYDTAVGRVTWTLPSAYTKESDLTIGGTFVEYMKDYETVGNYNRLTCADISYRNRSFGDLSVSTEVLRSEDGIDGMGILKDLGHKMDVNYNLGEFTYTLNYYNYGNRFRARTIDEYDLFIDLGGGNYGRGAGDILEQGENMIRFTGKYDYDNQGDERDFKVEGIVQQKAWEADPENPSETDHYNGELYSLEMWADMTQNSDARARFWFKKDAYAEETGMGHAELEINGKAIRDTVNTRLETYMERDADNENLNGKAESGYGVIGEVTADVTDFIWTKLVVEHHVANNGFHEGNMDVADLESDSDKFWNTERSVDEYHWENRFDLSTAVTFTGSLKGRWRNSTSYPSLDNSSHWVIGDLDWAFTDRLKGKATGWWKKNKGWWEEPKWRGVFQNIYAELIYDATDTTKLKLVFGDPVTWHKDDREDQGYNSVETEKKVMFEATTEF